MDKDKTGLPPEGTIDEFIEDLLLEKKPRAYGEPPLHEAFGDGEMEKMFETIRAVKRLRNNKVRRRVWQQRWFRGMAALAAALLIVLGVGNLRPGILPEVNMVEAVVKAYEELESYSGVVEIRGERGDIVEFRETIHIKYKKPFKYKAIHRYDGYETIYQSDGQKLAIVDTERVTVDNLFPEKELWRYHIGTTIYELEAASAVELIGTEILFGREAIMLEYRYSGDSESHFLWIDRATNLPLRKVLNHPEGTRLIVEFQELQINPVLEESIFALDLPSGIPVYNLNLNLALEQVQELWPQAATLPELMPQGLELWQAGKLEEYHLYEYVLRFQGQKETDFLDIFFASNPKELFYFQDSRMGRLGGGIVEINAAVRNIFEVYIGDSRMARWLMEERDIFIVSSRGTGELELLLEKLAGEQITFVEGWELQREGITPAYEKEGH
jgi:outer membrane lipoprotein-sorting protein